MSKKRHHIVPKGYLAQFTYDEAKKHVYGYIVNKHEFNAAISIKDCCVIRNTYKTGEKPDLLENKLAEWERPFIEKIRIAISLWNENLPINSEICSALQEASIIQYLRIPRNKLTFGAAYVFCNRDKFNRINQVYREFDLNTPVKTVEPYINNLYIDQCDITTIYKQITRGGDLFETYFCKVPEGSNFFTSDNPVIIFSNPNGTMKLNLTITELGVQPREVTLYWLIYPISPKYCLVWSPGVVVTDIKMKPTELTASEVEQINKKIIVGAQSIIISNVPFDRKSKDLIKSLIPS